MTRRLLLALLIALPQLASAQTETTRHAIFGYLSHEEVIKSMPEYADMQKNLEALRAQYDAEAKRSEDEFNKKYEEFLDGQHDFAPSIMKKRQAELEELMDKNTAFRKEAQRLYRQAEQEALTPLRDKLGQTLQKIGQERGYIFILNTDRDAVPYINTEVGDDITAEVKAALQ